MSDTVRVEEHEVSGRFKIARIMIPSRLKQGLGVTLGDWVELEILSVRDHSNADARAIIPPLKMLGQAMDAGNSSLAITITEHLRAHLSLKDEHQLRINIKKVSISQSS